MATTGTPQVNKPTDVKQKEADVNRKLQIYGIINAFSNGKVPSNDQIDVALNSFLASSALSNPSTELSAEGKTLVADLRDVVNQAKHLLLSKNEGNILQDFIWQTQQFDSSTINTPGAPVDKETAKQHGDKALEGLRTLGTLLITNGQFRKLLSDATILLRDMAGDAAASAASRVKPSEQELAQMHRPAEDNIWHDKPDLSKENLRKQVQGVYKNGSPKDDAQAVTDSGVTASQAEGSTVAGAQQAGITAQQRADISPEDKEAAKTTSKQYRARVKEYLGKKLPQEHREQTIWRLKKMVLECQQHPDYQQAIQTLLDLAEEYGGHANTLAQGGSGTFKDTRSNLAEAEADLKTLIERFANGTSTDELWSSINTIYKDADKDPELKDWFKAMDKYIRRCLQVQGYIIDDASTQEWNRLYDHGNYLLRNKYRSHTDHIINEAKFLTDQFDQDPRNKAFGQSMKKLFNDLGNDENGKPTFKPHLVKDLTGVIIPATFEKIAYIPVPRIEYSDPQVDAIIENLILESDNFMPNVLEIASDNYWRWGRKMIANKNKHGIDVKVAGIQMDLRDVSYHVKRKQGFPTLTDTGVANILLPGDGFTFNMKLSSADDKDKQAFFKVDKVDVDVKHLQIKLVKSNHKLLFNMFKPIMLRVLRPALQKAMEKAIKDNVNKFDRFLYEIKVEADRAKEEVASDPEKAPNVYSRYASAAQKRFMQGKQKAQEVTSDKKVNYAMTKEDSIFPNIKLPGGISSKASEYKELARKGERWESPVFSIGAASRSGDIPSAPQVAHKSHGATTAGATNSVTNGHGTVNGSNGILNSTGKLVNPATAGATTIST